MSYEKIRPLSGKLVNVVIETPKGSISKWDYDAELDIIQMKKILPLGMVFPFDFGFIPNTLAEDGDPLDVMVIMDQPGYPGCLVRVRIIGILEATQKAKGKPVVRNDRLIGIADCSNLYADVKDIDILNKNIVTQIENFCVDYNKHEDRLYKPIRWGNTELAMKMIKRHIL